MEEVAVLAALLHLSMCSLVRSRDDEDRERMRSQDSIIGFRQVLVMLQQFLYSLHKNYSDWYFVKQLQFYLEEANGNVDYQGYIFPRRRGESVSI